MRKRKITLSIATLVTILAAITLCTTKIFAATDDPFTGSVGNCTDYCSSWGVGWHRQTFDEYLNWNTGNVEVSLERKQQEVADCQKEGATEIYRLSYEHTYDRGASFIANEFSGAVWPGWVVPNGNSPYVNNLQQPSIAEDWYEVRANFIQAENLGHTQHPWNESSVFCWNDEWPTGDPVDGEFFATSTVKTTDGDIGQGSHSETSGEDGTVTVEFSTDKDSVTVYFDHAVIYKKSGNLVFEGAATIVKGEEERGDYKIFKDGKEITEITTNWGISSQSSKNGEAGTQSINPAQSSSPVTVSADGAATIKLKPGDDPITVCSEITYENKYFNFKAERILDQAATSEPTSYNTEDGHTITPEQYEQLTDEEKKNYAGANYQITDPKKWHYQYNVTSYGSGSSKACATVTRPANPSPDGDDDPGNDDPDKATLVGNNNTKITYAGESVSVQWNNIAENIPTRRIAAYQSVTYLIDASRAQNGRYFNLQERSSSSPASYFSGNNLGFKATAVYEDKSRGDNDQTQKYKQNDTASNTFKVPNTVGDKYCASSGYRFEYWWGVSRNGGATSWTYDQGKDYWYIFKGSCRTIAKKPTTAIWNSSLFTAGGITASIADRFDNINFGETTGDGETKKTTFGSWNEFLSVVGRKIRADGKTEFASGSIFYRGASPTDNSKNKISYYPLTIANTIFTNNDTFDPGTSGISANPATKTRLEAYLKNNSIAEDLTSSSIGGNGWTNFSDTRIYRASGSINIDGNITTAATKNGAPYTSIYDLPQVIIFVNGNVNISSNVSRIDAWIIAEGEINTCYQFETGEGEAKRGTQSDPSGGSGNTCANQLIFNGPVMARKLILNRSFGSDPNNATGIGIGPTDSTTNGSSRQSPAEIFNLRADTYLWAYAQSSRYDSSFTETYSRELAPRY